MCSNDNHHSLNLEKHFVLLSTLLLPIIYFSYLNRTLQLDDALIYQRYVRNLLDGYGLVYNLGEIFNALTSPFFTYLTIVASFIIGNIQQATIILATVATTLTIYLLIRVFSRYENFYFVLFGALFMALFPYTYLIYGMETPLFLLLISLCIFLFEERKEFWLGIACALLLITRSEGIFLILALAIEHFRQKRPFPKLSHFLIPLLIIVATYSFNKFYYGSFLSGTGAAKIYQGQSGLWGVWPAFQHVTYQFGGFFSNNKLLLHSLLILAISGVISLRLKPLNVIIISFLIFYTLFYVILNIPNYHWYYAPYYLMGFFYSGVGLAWWAHNLWSAKDIIFRIMGATAIAIIIPLVLYQAFHATLNKVDIGGIAKPYWIIGNWLRENTPKDAKIALIEIGTVGWYSERYIIDILGLVNPFNAKFIGEKKFNAWLQHYAPNYILIHQPVTGHEAGIKDAVLFSDFEDEPRLQVPGFKLLVQKQQNLPLAVLPQQINSPSPTQLAFEQEHAVLLVHAPGEVRLPLTKGKYTVTGKFGILAGAYEASNQFPTDGVEFSITVANKVPQEEQILFKRFLNPLAIEQDRGLQQFTITSLELDEDGELVLHTQAGTGNNFQSDWSFWKAVIIKKEK
jgi:hypothetical protein